MAIFSPSLIFGVLVILALSSCGGGGGGDDSNDASLTGTWIYASAGNRTGSACGLDVNNIPEERNTLKFDGKTYTGKFENCQITSGSTGTFELDGEITATYRTGDVYITDDGYKLKEIDMTTTDPSGDKFTYYAGYNITGNQLRGTNDDPDHDGSSPSKREIIVSETVYIKQ